MYQVLFLGGSNWRCNSCSVSPSFSLSPCSSVCPLFVCEAYLEIRVCVCIQYIYIYIYICSHAAWGRHWRNRTAVVNQSSMLDVNLSVSHPSVCQCSKWAPKGVVFMEGSAAEAHSRWHFSHSQTRPCPILTTYNPTAPPGTWKLWWVLNRWNEYDENSSTVNQSEAGAVMLTRSQSYASGSSGRDRGSWRDSVTKPPAGSAVGQKLHPGQMVFLISSVGPLPLVHFSISYLANLIGPLGLPYQSQKVIGRWLISMWDRLLTGYIGPRPLGPNLCKKWPLTIFAGKSNDKHKMTTKRQLRPQWSKTKKNTHKEM